MSGMEYRDLAAYDYTEFLIPMRAVGWLGLEHGVQGGDLPPLTGDDVERIGIASGRIVNVMLGLHACEFCVDGPAVEGTGEYRYYSRKGEVYSAPAMVLHYIAVHGYRPPQEFLDCVHETDPLDWDWRAERLYDLLMDEDGDMVLRTEAVADIANWRDPRSLEALLHATTVPWMVSGVGDEIGRSLGALLECDFARDVRIEELPEPVAAGVGTRAPLDVAAHQALHR
jgi:hypothetical protein